MTAEAADERVALVFTVSDQGIRIADEQLQRLFTPFTRADESMSRRYGDSSLGLAICRQLADCMDGEVWSKNTV